MDAGLFHCQSHERRREIPMNRIKVGILVAAGIIMTALPAWAVQQSARSSNLKFFRTNNCVLCHSRLTEPVRVSAHFYQWLNSNHEKHRVGCEKCHGGDPMAKDKVAAHKGVFNHASAESRLHPSNINTTCRECHEQAVDAFVTSDHFQKVLKDDGAPNCTTCHQHMANSVVYWPPDTVKLCAECHRENGSASNSLDVPRKGGDIVAAFTRADEVIDWSFYLINEGKKRRLNLRAEESELKKLQGILEAAKLKYHAFDIERSREMADQVFNSANKIKNGLAGRGL